MNFFKNIKESLLENIQARTVSGILIVTYIILITHISSYATVLSKLWASLESFVFGLIFAFLLLPIRNRLESKILSRTKLQQSKKRMISVLICMIIALLLVIMFFMILIPQIGTSISSFSQSFGTYTQKIEEYISLLDETEYAEVTERISELFEQFTTMAKQWLTGNGGLIQIVNHIIGFGKNITNMMVGIIICIFVLLDSEKFARQVKVFVYGLLPEKAGDWIFDVLRLTGKMFNSFIVGKAIDSLIIGILCYIGVMLLKIPYPVLIAVIVGLTNMIPFFGPFIGAVPCIVILLLINPFSALKFTIFIIILQQFDGNLLGPHILGDSMGLPTLWIMFAIMIGGSLMGIVGMFIGVPIFSVIYTMFGGWLNQQTEKKQITL